VLKDEHTITSVPYRQTYLNMSGNSGMAVAGSGDVLSGVIGSLMAQGMPAEKAAPLGVYLHGCAGDIMMGTASKRGMVASDIIEGIRQVAVELEKMRG
jgi:NAD(P)H-hydrate epimerase